MKDYKIYDISVVIREDSDNYVKEEPRIPIGQDIFNGFRVQANIHYGTHVDCPYHKAPNKKLVEDYPLERFILPAVVIESMDPESVKLADVKDVPVEEGFAVLFKTENSRSGRSKILPFQGPMTYIEPDALKNLVDRGVSLVGFDSPHGEHNAPTMEEQENPIHTMMFDNDRIILESVDLADVPAGGGYTLLALPVKFHQCSGSPVRAVLLKKE